MAYRYTERDWNIYLLSVGLRPELVEAYMSYVHVLYGRGLPVVFEFGHLADLLGRTRQYLASAVNSPADHYRVFRIPKRRGGFRTISAPYPALLECQQWVLRYILPAVRVHSAAHGFLKKRTIKTNASLHLGKKCLLKMDLADFFPSIELPRVIKVFRMLGYSKDVSFYLAALCTLDEHLPQGAATSPALSNTIAFGLDNRLSGLAKKWKLKYTRYADDLTFSGDWISLRFPKIVGEIVEDEGFEVQHSKTRVSRNPGKRTVTGLSVRGEKLRTTREFRRQLKQEVHYILKFGYHSHSSKLKIRDPFYLQSVLGRLLFWKWIEPDNEYVGASCERIQSLIPSS